MFVKLNPSWTSLYRVGVKSLSTARGEKASAVIAIRFLPSNIPVYLFFSVASWLFMYRWIFLISSFVSDSARVAKSMSSLLYSIFLMAGFSSSVVSSVKTSIVFSLKWMILSKSIRIVVRMPNVLADWLGACL